MLWAHSRKDKPPEQWQPLDHHLRNVATRAAEFAESFQSKDWAYIAGLWHDLGKGSLEFQKYLKSQNEACAESLSGRVDHSSAGAQHAASAIPILGHILSYAIAGHHAGLLDGRAEGACQEKRLSKAIHPWKCGLQDLLISSGTPEVPKCLQRNLAERDAFAVAFFVRMVFSCLVDGDFLDTEFWLQPEKADARKDFPKLEGLFDVFFRSLDDFQAREKDNPLAALRRQIRLDCERAGEWPPGFFSLTVPTGGGKTLSSLAFALRHAQKHVYQRVVYVAPFTTIIEQNAGVFRAHLGRNAVLEHHSNLDATKETAAARLAAENWDAPVIVTTSVQFYESLFSNSPSRCRKLHRIARSVIILDEAQTLPVDYLKPCLKALQLLVRDYGCSVVLCTATQPEIRKRSDFSIGLENVREIMTEPRKLYAALKRVNVKLIGKQTDAQLCGRLLAERQGLCIANTTKHARLLFEGLPSTEGHFHLSARMCPAHRRLRMWQIRQALKSGAVCRVVSTQVVEAGVDLDFPVVYRAMAGLDSIAQAAGRCNRNNKLGRLGNVFIFTSEHRAANQYFKDTADCADQVMASFSDPLDLDANERYFKLYYWDQQSRWDAHHIHDLFHLEQNRDFPFNFGFMQAAEKFHMIDDKATCTVLVPWGRRGQRLCEKIRDMPAPDRETLRQAQRFAVHVHQAEWSKHAVRDIRLVYDNLGILESPEIHYHAHTGLNLDADGPGALFA